MQKQELSSNKKQSNKGWFDYKRMAERLGSLCDETEMVLLIDKNATIRFINEAAAQKRFKKKMSNLLGRCIWKLLEPEAAKRRKAVFEQVVQSKVPMRFVDERSGWWIDTMVYPLLSRDGSVLQVLVLGRDITTFKEHERKIQEMNQKLEDQLIERTAELKKQIEELRQAENTLSIQRKDLEDLNTTLRVFLQKAKEDIDQIKEHAVANMKYLILPHLEKLLETNLNPQQQNIVKLVYEELITITSPFSNTLSSGSMSLTPKEIQIAELIREGKTSKEIATSMTISTKTVDLHREHIRKKLGIMNKKTNLRTYLFTIH